jgi:hypothetical protein
MVKDNHSLQTKPLSREDASSKLCLRGALSHTGGGRSLDGDKTADTNSQGNVVDIKPLKPHEKDVKNSKVDGKPKETVHSLPDTTLDDVLQIAKSNLGIKCEIWELRTDVMRTALLKEYGYLIFKEGASHEKKRFKEIIDNYFSIAAYKSLDWKLLEVIYKELKQQLDEDLK